MKQEPIFKTILGTEWENLGDIIKRHYFLRERSSDNICVSGEMSEIYHSLPAKALIPIALIFGAVVPYKGKRVPVDVYYSADSKNANIYWDRVFKFKHREFHFKSHMEPVKHQEVIEFVRFGLGIKLRVSCEGGALVFRDIGYIWRILGFKIPLPGRWLMGRIYVEERPIDHRQFSMKMELRHPLLGMLFKYSGKFSLPS
ncbi:MAG: DUF4166 domain-containing protein [Agarilytica sp.]